MYELLGSHSSVAEDSSPLVYDIILIGKVTYFVEKTVTPITKIEGAQEQ
jgi:hypothetical protein